MNSTSIAHRNTGLVVAGTVAAGAALVGIVVAMMLAFGGSAHATAAPKPVPSNSSVTPSTPPASRPVTPVAIPLTTAQITTLQTQLGQLDYYEGPVNGIMTAQTVQSLRYLQRDAELPQNGVFDQATYQALQRMLVTGNNQMGN